jgi:hypothetical protein
MTRSNTELAVSITFNANTGTFRVTGGSTEAYDTSLPLALKAFSFRAHGQPPRFTLGELLAQCDPTAPENEIALEWERAAPVGRERIDE